MVLTVFACVYRTTVAYVTSTNGLFFKRFDTPFGKRKGESTHNAHYSSKTTYNYSIYIDNHETNNHNNHNPAHHCDKYHAVLYNHASDYGNHLHHSAHRAGNYPPYDAC